MVCGPNMPYCMTTRVLCPQCSPHPSAVSHLCTATEKQVNCEDSAVVP